MPWETFVNTLFLVPWGLSPPIPRPCPQSDLHTGLQCPREPRFICRTSPPCRFSGSTRGKNPPEPLPRVWGARLERFQSRNPEEGDPPSPYDWLQMTSWKWPSVARSPGASSGSNVPCRGEALPGQPGWAPAGRRGCSFAWEGKALVQHLWSPRVLWTPFQDPGTFLWPPGW